MDFDLDKSSNMQGLEAFVSKNKEFEILKAKYSGNFIYDLTMFLWGWQRLRWQSVHCTSLGTEIQFPNTHLTGGCSMCCNPSPGKAESVGSWSSLANQSRTIRELWVQWATLSHRNKVESNQRRRIASTSDLQIMHTCIDDWVCVHAHHIHKLN